MNVNTQAAGNYFPIAPVQPEAVTPEAAKPKVDFKKAAEQQNQAVRTHAVYTRGLKDYDQLVQQLQEFGQAPGFTAEKLAELEISPDITVREALQAIENYNNAGKKQVEDLARKNVKIGSQIREEGKVRKYTERLWNSDEPNVKSDRPNVHFKAKYYKAHPNHRYPSLQIPVSLGLVGGFLMNGLQGALIGGLTAYGFNQLHL